MEYMVIIPLWHDSMLLLHPKRAGSSQTMWRPCDTFRNGGTGLQERVPTNQGNRHSRLRSSPWVDRQGDTDFGIPYPLRALPTASEGSSGLVSEQIHNVLGFMRRGERLRIEDVMILDQSVLLFSGVADFHDRHKDMRLDVDDMSYEELLALEERIGNVSTGLSEETISNRLKQKKYVVVGESHTDKTLLYLSGVGS